MVHGDVARLPSASYRDKRADVPAVGRQGARADIEVSLIPLHGPTLLDISMNHPRCASYVAAASQTRGNAAALRDRDKLQADAGHLHQASTVGFFSGGISDEERLFPSGCTDG
jgi:hypothetical protein